MKKLITLITILFALNVSAQTIMKNIPIQSDGAYEIKVWVFDEAKNKWRWGDVYETGIEEAHGWIYERKINLNVERYDTFDILIIRGFEECSDTTRVVIYGNYDKTKIKDSPNLREVIKVNGQTQIFGNKIERP